MLADRFLLEAKAIANDSIGTRVAPRGVAASYYAVFHCFSEAGVELLLAPHPFTRERVRRLFMHEGLGKVARTVASSDSKRDPSKLNAWLNQAPPGFEDWPSNELRTACASLGSLYAQRIEADYSGKRRFSFGDLQTAVREAETAVSHVRTLAREGDEQLRLLLGRALWTGSPFDKSV